MLIGWDIIEPITYSVTQLTVLLGLRFFMKNKAIRDWTTMQEISRMNRINKSPLLKEQYTSILQQIKHLEDQQILLKARIDLYKHRKSFCQDF